MATNPSSGNGKVACPVCTLYLREGISLQEHLDTHPKEQVIEALIRASSSGLPLLSQQTPSPLQQKSSPTSQASQTALPDVSVPTVSQGPHITPQHPSAPYPVGPIYECPPMIPPHFTSYSYQHYVNGVFSSGASPMVMPQYAVAQPQNPQTSQMMQMVYNPFSMYHQQLQPAVQMISSPTQQLPHPSTLTTPLISTTSTATTAVSAPISASIAPRTRMNPPTSSACISEVIQPTSTLAISESTPRCLDKPKETTIVPDISNEQILPDLEVTSASETNSKNQEHNENIENPEEQVQRKECSQPKECHNENYECADTRIISSSNKVSAPKSSSELLNMNENAHAGPINLFEYDSLRLLLPSTLDCESSQKAVSVTSQQSLASSENEVGVDEEVKSVNMRADETMPARGELSEQESNGFTEQSAWQINETT
ncbi:unnamed protein product [Trichogramma brassicae]|uniref:C2H2-type domain-containing protein n=1 Tax=Trichogramma brassicae TaxID=86971 RepID=A0A6H5IQ05_9HYME|nr:unnamed protein product [Trichogramma brassicae]